MLLQFKVCLSLASICLYLRDKYNDQELQLYMKYRPGFRDVPWQEVGPV